MVSDDFSLDFSNQIRFILMISNVLGRQVEFHTDVFKSAVLINLDLFW